MDKLIPFGAEHCHFSVERLKDEKEKHPWDQYSDELAKRALEKQKKDPRP